MTVPGVDISVRDTPPARSAPTDTGVWFVVGLAERGKLEPLTLNNMADYTRLLGARVSYGLLYDSLDQFFREGGGIAKVSRVVGPAPVTAFYNLQDSVPANTLKVEADSPGEWGNALNVQVIAGTGGGTFVLIISHDTLGELERSPDLADKSAALMWALGSDYIKLTDMAGTGDPAVGGPFNLSTGADDRVNIVEANWETALTRFTKDMGPGQVSYPGRTTTQGYLDLREHAKANRRTAILDAEDTPTKATLITAANANRVEGRYAGMFWPWMIVPGLTPATFRSVPPSAMIAGIIARNDPSLSPSQPAAGDDGISRYSVDMTRAPFSDAEREELNGVGINVIREMYGTFRNYGWRSLSDPVTDANWTNLGYARALMAIANEADIIAETFIFELLDGQRRTINRFGAALTGMLLPYWIDSTLYGLTPDQAFFVDVGEAVNTEQTIANFELKAVLSVRMSPFAEHVIIEIVKRLVTEEVA